jgi:hypothetical protein
MRLYLEIFSWDGYLMIIIPTAYIHGDILISMNIRCWYDNIRCWYDNEDIVTLESQIQVYNKKQEVLNNISYS